MVESEPFTVLLVCTGNICRSPLAEQLLRARFAAAGIPAVIHSAGTGALVGYPMTPEAASLSRRYGGDPAGHSARQLTPDLIESADLVLTATRQHRGYTVSLVPRAVRHTFSLNQLARLIAVFETTHPISVAGTAETAGTAGTAEAAGTAETAGTAGTARTAGTLRAYVADVAATRGIVAPAVRAVDDDIVDPFRQSQPIYDEAGSAIDSAVATIAAGFARAIRGQ
jgi:protein-tyrosine phosphatase